MQRIEKLNNHCEDSATYVIKFGNKTIQEIRKANNQWEDSATYVKKLQSVSKEQEFSRSNHRVDRLANSIRFFQSYYAGAAVIKLRIKA